MRMDEDSMILSPLPPQMFERLEAKGIQYAYRLASYESGVLDDDPETFHNFLRAYMQQQGLSPLWLLDSCGLSSEQRADTHLFSRQLCGELRGFYNNWYISSVTFWRTPEVLNFLRHVDQLGYIYTRRWGDLPVQSAAIQMFMAREHVLFDDSFTYQHATYAERERHDEPIAGTLGVALSEHSFNDETFPGEHTAHSQSSLHAPPKQRKCIMYGGIAAGVNDPDGLERVHDLIGRGAFCQHPCIRTYLRPLPAGQRLMNREYVLVAAATAGTVFVETPDCRQEPFAFSCFGWPLAGSSHSLAAAAAAPAFSSDRSANGDPAALAPSNMTFAKRAHHAFWRKCSLAASIERTKVGSHGGLLTAKTQVATRAKLEKRKEDEKRCEQAVLFVYSHPHRQNPRSGVHFWCPTSIRKYLARCRGEESGCGPAQEIIPGGDHPMPYTGTEVIDCSERALLDSSAGAIVHSSAPPANATVPSSVAQQSATTGGAARQQVSAVSPTRVQRSCAAQKPVALVASPRCRKAVHKVMSSSMQHNPRSGVVYECASSVKAYLAICRPESHCYEYATATDTSTTWSDPRLFNCSERALVTAPGAPPAPRRLSEGQVLPPALDGVETTTTASVSSKSGLIIMASKVRRHLWRQHHCERSLPGISR